jgi:hypothetical protein
MLLYTINHLYQYIDYPEKLKVQVVALKDRKGYAIKMKTSESDNKNIFLKHSTKNELRIYKTPSAYMRILKEIGIKRWDVVPELETTFTAQPSTELGVY